MSDPNEKSVTHDSFGTEPAAEGLTFELKWKNYSGGANSDDNIAPPKIIDKFDTTEKRNWNSFKTVLRDVAFGHGYSIDERVTYVDSDGDEIPIESQCEFEEALKFAKTRAVKKQSVFLIVEGRSVYRMAEKNNIPKSVIGNESVKNLKKVESFCVEAVTSQPEKTYSAMPPMQLDEVVRRGQWQSQCNIVPSTRTEIPSDTAPKWFTNYMQTMKEEIVTEVSTRVTKAVLEALSKKRDSQYDSATSHPRSSDSECVFDSDCLFSDLEDDRSERYSSKPRDDRINSTERTGTTSIETREKKTSETSLRSGVHRYENSRRRYRHADKQRKKHKKNHLSQIPCNDETPVSVNKARRAEKTSRKRETDYSRSLPQSTGNSERSEQIAAPSNVGEVPENGEKLEDTQYRKMMSSGIRQTSFIGSTDPIEASSYVGEVTENGEKLEDTQYRRMMSSGIRQTSFIGSTDPIEAPTLKLRLANQYNGSGPNSETKLTEDKLRMGCSVTGQDMLDRPNNRVPNYDALSDSDNISIISDVSLASDMQRINNSFELILQRSMNFADEAETYGNERLPLITTEYGQAEREIDDLDNARDSSSFELLSEPPSPALSIHMDEDHFSPGENEAGNYNINDETTVDKRGNQSKIEICPYAIDAQGKMYQQNIVEGDEEVSEEIVLEKRSGGAYSFVGETLPGSTKESMIVTEIRIEEPIEEVPDAAAGVSDNVSCDAGVEVTVETKLDGDCRQNSNDAFHDSTQSFHSHTATQAENDRQDYASSREREEAPRSRVFVDRNASKGLGDTRRTSPRKQPTTGNKNAEEGKSDRPRSTRKNSHDSHASGNRSSNSRQGERSRRFGNWPTTRSTRMMDDLVFNTVDPMHILPETLVTGAVHVASSAYTTARRVYDKILTAQTRKPADKSKFGRR